MSRDRYPRAVCYAIGATIVTGWYINAWPDPTALMASVVVGMWAFAMYQWHFESRKTNGGRST